MDFTSAVAALHEAGVVMRRPHGEDSDLRRRLDEHYERIGLETAASSLANYLYRAVSDLRDVARMADEEAGRSAGDDASLMQYVEAIIREYPTRMVEVVADPDGKIGGTVGSRARLAADELLSSRPGQEVRS